MAATGIQYGRAAVLAERLAATLAAGGRPGDVDASGFEDVRDAVVDLVESRRRYLGQMDLNIASDLVWDFYADTLDTLAGYGAAIVRLDAFAYAPKEPGARNFLNDPGTWDLLARVKELADARGLLLLPEIHSTYAEGIHETIAAQGFMTYDFFLPGLVIDALRAPRCHGPQALDRRGARQEHPDRDDARLPRRDPAAGPQGPARRRAHRGPDRDGQGPRRVRQGPARREERLLPGQRDVLLGAGGVRRPDAAGPRDPPVHARQAAGVVPRPVRRAPTTTTRSAKAGPGGHKEINRTNLTARGRRGRAAAARGAAPDRAAALPGDLRRVRLRRDLRGGRHRAGPAADHLVQGRRHGRSWTPTWSRRPSRSPPPTLSGTREV